jgi:hypothetical protein
MIDADEHGIIFSAPMVRLVLARQKTQTRRIFKLPKGWNWYSHNDGTMITPGRSIIGVGELSSPYGDVGDRLWVRETFCLPFARTKEDAGAIYRADKDIPGYTWKSSRHMPRWASRINLEIVGKKRVERLCDISSEDCEEEIGDYNPCAPSGKLPPKYRFMKTWQSIYGVGSWCENPWVQVVEFKLISPK